MATELVRAHARRACCQDEEVLASPSKRAIAQAERERLRAMAKNKKELLKSMKQQEHSNAAAAAGEVGTLRALAGCLHVHTFRRAHSTPPSQAERARNRLQFLLKQAEIFQHFAPENSSKGK